MAILVQKITIRAILALIAILLMWMGKVVLGSDLVQQAATPVIDDFARIKWPPSVIAAFVVVAGVVVWVIASDITQRWQALFSPKSRRRGR